MALDSVITIIPGMSPLEAGMILDEIGNIHRSANSSKLLAFTGLDLTVRQSGKFQANRTRMSKRNSKILRYALAY